MLVEQLCYCDARDTWTKVLLPGSRHGAFLVLLSKRYLGSSTEAVEQAGLWCFSGVVKQAYPRSRSDIAMQGVPVEQCWWCEAGISIGLLWYCDARGTWATALMWRNREVVASVLGPDRPPSSPRVKTEPARPPWFP
ncbi:hypothetical protein NDU88_001290 [Pleurodeles waltl]|uniref:Uncharacterized protein n=1 Tax=Pleurodeles waltl TaxID=8319 RepID=A0AAV7U826_PLEWA|nr:hypothetical protein NDU88_001290 [Pleurodeles waltl]